ncbi:MULTISPECIES: hypothetical protein [Streptomyces]|uniref:Uncharacterized protein n=1 Tax=Streptomyces edwardsiae TaxID=3075527 RepID=A0ABU2QBH1_9ACTN|nr:MULTISPECIES: hypothetical protein [unclassified Streptomyces]MDT0401792.1 hypothetical protein [Streptomyces sp. DSM 41635]
MSRDSGEGGYRARHTFALSCWVPRTRMHIDEIAEVNGRLSWGPGRLVRHADGTLHWPGRRCDIDGLICRELSFTLATDGHLFITGHLGELGTGVDRRSVLGRLTEWAHARYMEVLASWTALHSDVLAGAVEVGRAGVLGAVHGDTLGVYAADAGVIPDGPLTLDQIRPLLLIAACRRFVYSTTAQFRALDREAKALREAATTGGVDQVERLSVLANSRIDGSRTARSRLEIAVQTLRNQLENHPETTAPVRQEFLDLILVAEHMASVWQTKETNLEWVVQHAALRVGIAERRATRSFTAAVFAVAVVAVMRDIVDSSLNAGIIEWSMYRVLVLVLSSAAVVVLSYLLYLVAKRFIR